jgi:hypothetical protein
MALVITDRGVCGVLVSVALLLRFNVAIGHNQQYFTELWGICTTAALMSGAFQV